VPTIDDVLHARIQTIGIEVDVDCPRESDYEDDDVEDEILQGTYGMGEY